VRRLFLLVAAVVLVDTMFYAAITPLLPTYRDELGLSKTAAGVLSGSYAAGTLLGSLPVGALITRLGAKRMLLSGLALMSCTSLVFGFANHIVLLDAARFLQGVGGACSWGAGLAWLISATPADRRGELIGAAIAAAIGGVLLGPVLGGAATLAGPEPVFSLVAVLGAGLAVWALSVEGPPPGRRSRLREVVRAMASRPVAAAFWLAILPSLYSGTLVVLGPLRLDELGASGVAIGGVFLVGALLEGAVSAVVGRVSDRRGRHAPIRAGLIGGAFAAVLLPLPDAALLLAVAIIAAVVALAAFWAPAFALLSEAGDAVGLDQGYAFALTNLAWAGGQVSGAGAGAWIAERAGDAVPYAGLAVLCSLTFAVLAVPRRPSVRTAA
jgi:MFS family permease